MTRVFWLKEGALVPRGHKLLQVLMQELRPVPGRGHKENWLLCEFEVEQWVVTAENLTWKTPDFLR